MPLFGIEVEKACHPDFIIHFNCCTTYTQHTAAETSASENVALHTLHLSKFIRLCKINNKSTRERSSLQCS